MDREVISVGEGVTPHSRVHELKSLLGPVEDPDSILKPELCRAILGTMDLADQERANQGLEPLTLSERKFIARAGFDGAYAHVGATRDSGEDYFLGHAVIVANDVIQDQGITDPATIAAGLLHDTIEDSDGEISPDDLIHLDAFEGQEKIAIERIRRDAIKAVIALTKLKSAGTEGIIQDLLLYLHTQGIRAPRIKSSDKGHNLRTYGTYRKPEKRAQLMREGKDLFIELDRFLGLRQSVKRKVQACIAFQDETTGQHLLEDFSTLQAARLNELWSQSHRDLIDTRVRRYGTRFSKHKGRSRRVEVHFVPDHITKFVIDRDFLAPLSIKDLDISSRDPLGEVQVILKTPGPVTPERKLAMCMGVARFLEDSFPHSGEPCREYLGDRGYRIQFYTPAIKGIVRFRINTSIDEATSKQGYIKGAGQLSDESRGLVKGVLDQAKRRGGSIIKLAQQEIFRPQITVFTKDGEPHQFTKGATVLDFAAKVHEDGFIGIQRVYLYKGVNSEKYDREISIFDELTDGMVLEVESCIPKGEKRQTYRSQILAKPEWIPFCATSKAREDLRAHLREKAGKEYTPEERAVICTRGKEYVEKVSRLYNISEKDLFAVLRKKYTFIQRDHWKDEDIYFEIGRAADHFELIHIVSDTFDKEVEWKLSVVLPDVAGSEHDFTGVLKAKGINIKQHESHDKKGGGYDEICIIVAYEDATTPPKDMIKLILRLSQKYNVRIEKIVKTAA